MTRGSRAETVEDLDLFRSVVTPGYCSGCGACAGMHPGALTMVVDRYGAYIPAARDGEGRDAPAGARAVCPFADGNADEDAIGQALFAGVPGIRHAAGIGFYMGCFAGAVADDSFRAGSTSGGVTSWVLQRLLAERHVDAIAAVGLAGAPGPLFEYQVIRDPAGIAQLKKSRYYPAEMSRILPAIRGSRERFAFVGLPCFVKAVRHAMQADPRLKERIACTVGLFCGHLKTRCYAHYLARCCGVHERDIETVDFRAKVIGGRKTFYASDFEVTWRDKGVSRQSRIRMKDVFAGAWTYNLFMLKSCDYCDDITCETADISLGDAWLPEYMADWRGTNLLVTRSPFMHELVERGMQAGGLRLDRLPIERAIESNAGASRHRHAGLAYRLSLDDAAGIRHPRKRVAARRSQLTIFRKCIQRLRLRIRALSHEAFLEQQPEEGLEVFKRRLRFWVALHDRVYQAEDLAFRARRRLLPRRLRAAAGKEGA